MLNKSKLLNLFLAKNHLKSLQSELILGTQKQYNQHLIVTLTWLLKQIHKYILIVVSSHTLPLMYTVIILGTSIANIFYVITYKIYAFINGCFSLWNLCGGMCKRLCDAKVQLRGHVNIPQ